jgi:hypothetical protein
MNSQVVQRENSLFKEGTGLMKKKTARYDFPGRLGSNAVSGRCCVIFRFLT